MTNSDKMTVGFVGLGHLGGRMAARLAEAGHELVVFDHHAEHVDAVPGARGVGSPAEVAEAAQVVFTCLPSEEAARAAVLGDGDGPGLASALGEGSGLVECSTVSPATARELAGAVRAGGAEAIDASVSGSTAPAEQGELVLLVGGDRPLHDRCAPLFDALAKRTFYMGDSGTGATTKLVVNTMLGVGMQALAEAYTLGAKAGLDPERLEEVLSGSDTVAVAHQPKVEHLADGEQAVQFALRLMHKDYGLIADLAEEVGAVMPATAVAAQLNAAEHATGGEEDFSAVARLMLRLSGGAPADLDEVLAPVPDA
jgi:3-hydroxyisobutyrate dehydrogenase-like beta-hydroxyacid dehydrogenase